jgi:hypothetical protein
MEQIPGFHDFRRPPFPIDELRETRDRAAASADASARGGDADMGLSPGGSSHRVGFWARLTEAGTGGGSGDRLGHYGFYEVYWDDDAEEWVELEGGQEGEKGAASAAVEAGLDGTIYADDVDGTVVWLEPDPASQGWLFGGSGVENWGYVSRTVPGVIRIDDFDNQASGGWQPPDEIQYIGEGTKAFREIFIPRDYTAPPTSGIYAPAGTWIKSVSLSEALSVEQFDDGNPSKGGLLEVFRSNTTDSGDNVGPRLRDAVIMETCYVSTASASNAALWGWTGFATGTGGTAGTATCYWTLTPGDPSIPTIGAGQPSACAPFAVNVKVSALPPTLNGASAVQFYGPDRYRHSFAGTVEAVGTGAMYTAGNSADAKFACRGSNGGDAVTGGLTFVGGLYISGSLSVGAIDGGTA